MPEAARPTKFTDIVRRMVEWWEEVRNIILNTESAIDAAERAEKAAGKAEAAYSGSNIVVGRVFDELPEEAPDGLTALSLNDGVIYEYAGAWLPVQKEINDGTVVANQYNDRKYTKFNGSFYPDIMEINYPKTAIPLFTPRYWVIDGSSTSSFSLTTNGMNAKIYFTARRTSDFAGLIWNTEDVYSHEGFKYATKTDLSDSILRFRLKVSGDWGFVDYGQSGGIFMLTLTTNNGETYYSPMMVEQLISDGAVYEAIFRYDFSDPDIPEGYAVDVKTLMFGISSKSYEISGSAPLTQNENVTFEFELLPSMNNNTRYYNIEANKIELPKHTVRMCTAYDDIYNISPERLMETTHGLGYRKIINHYVGMSHYYEKLWNGAEQRWKVTGAVLNTPAEQWHRSLNALCKQYGYDIVYSISYELFSESCPYEWTQRDWNDNYAATGYSPPSFLLSPCVADAMSFLKNIFIRFADMLASAGLPVIMQVGEPWWWANPATKRPCIYDYQTRLAFNAATGLYAMDIGLTDNFQTGYPYDEYVEFVKNKLGDSVLSVRDYVLAAYSDAEVTVLPFLPTIFDGGLMQRINYPVAQYSYPNFPWYMTEGYDWMLEGDMVRLYESANIPEETLGYTRDRISLLVGFVPVEVDAPLYGFDPESNYRAELWKRIIGHIANNAEEGLRDQYIWAYPQIVQDSLILLPGEARGYFFLGKDAYRAYTDNVPLKIGRLTPA